MEESYIKELVAYNLKKIRKSKHISQADLAEKVDRSVTFISELEQGKKGFSTETLTKLCTGLDIEPCQLFLPRSYAKTESGDISSAFNELKDLIQSVELKYKIKLQ